MYAFTGTAALMRLALRRDRVKLSVWIIALAAVLAGSVTSTLDLYGNDLAARTTYALTTAPSVVGRVFNGPLNGPDAGAIVLNETFLTMAIAVAFMSTLAVVRHTRQNEETGRAELIGSAVVGRYASLSAALLVTMGANIVLGGLVALILQANGLPAAGSMGAGGALAATGIVFASLAAITAQASESARGANSLAALAIGVAFLLRGIGDGMGNLVQNGLSVQSAWISWLSPLGWAQQLHPYTEAHWWTFGLMSAFAATAVGTAFWLTNHRDIGLGMLPVRMGPATAHAALSTPFGLAWRLQKGVLKGWAVAIAILGVSYGFVIKDFGNLVSENKEVAELMQRLGGNGNVTDILLGALFFFMALTVAAYAVQSLQRLRTEEAGGQLEALLATATSRPRWALSHIACTLIGVGLLTCIAGSTLSATYVLAVGQPAGDILTLTGAMFVHIPSILAVAGFVVAMFGMLPRLTVGLAWGMFAGCLLIGQLGAILRLPQWTLNLSPFSHTPSAPAEPITILPLLVLSAAAAALFALGLITFRRRDSTAA